MVLESLVVEASESYRGRTNYLIYFDHALGYTDITSNGNVPLCSELPALVDELVRKRLEPYLFVTQASDELFLEIVHYADLIGSRKDAYMVLRRLSAI